MIVVASDSLLSSDTQAMSMNTLLRTERRCLWLPKAPCTRCVDCGYARSSIASIVSSVLVSLLGSRQFMVRSRASTPRLREPGPGHLVGAAAMVAAKSRAHVPI